ncbi:hypothetical protein [Streptomyces fagopyri]|uniref:hypothetical protein n=1 Tax=Streptomyces fagopyri TaxID=2662397 RepID=UPI0038056914
MEIDLPKDLINQQRAANEAHAGLLELQERFRDQEGPGVKVPPSAWTDEQHAEWVAQRDRWRSLVPGLHAAVTEFAKDRGLSRYDVEMALKRAAKAESAGA